VRDKVRKNPSPNDDGESRAARCSACAAPQVLQLVESLGGVAHDRGYPHNPAAFRGDGDDGELDGDLRAVFSAGTLSSAPDW